MIKAKRKNALLYFLCRRPMPRRDYVVTKKRKEEESKFEVLKLTRSSENSIKSIYKKRKNAILGSSKIKLLFIKT